MRIGVLRSASVPLEQQTRVLLVEHDAAEIERTRAALVEARGAPCELVVHRQLSAALDELAARSPDVVLLDLGLPERPGLTALTLLRARSRRVPVIVLDGFDDEARALDALRLGAQDYLVKGEYEGPELARIVRHAIERQRRVRNLELALEHARYQRNGFAARAAGGAEGPLALCAWCKKFRAAPGDWRAIEEFFAAGRVSVTHGACPACRRDLLRANRKPCEGRVRG